LGLPRQNRHFGWIPLMWISPTARRLLWFVGLWAAGVLAVGVVSYGIRLMIM
jgi:hypothetical protein